MIMRLIKRDPEIQKGNHYDVNMSLISEVFGLGKDSPLKVKRILNDIQVTSEETKRL